MRVTKPRPIKPLLTLLAIAVLAIPAAASVRAPVLRWSAAKLIDRAQPFGDPADVVSVSCPTAAFCLGAGTQGTVVSATGGSAPKVVQVGLRSYADLDAVSCPTTRLCVALTFDGEVLITTNPTATKPAWTAAPEPPDTKLETIDCPTASLCVAQDSDGGMWTSTAPATASSWTPTQPDGWKFQNAVACAPGGQLCVAAANSFSGSGSDGGLATTTSPAAGPTAWTFAPAPSTAGSMVAVTCPSTALCVGVSRTDVLWSSDPAAGGSSWSQEPIPDAGASAGGVGATGIGGVVAYGAGVGCGSATPSSCVVVLSDGSLLTGSGSAVAPSWTRSAVLDPAGFSNQSIYPEGLNPVGCRPGATASCLVGDGLGRLAQVVVSGAGTPGATTKGVGGMTAITGVACPSASLCVGVDNAGALLRTAKPAGPASGWRRQVRPGSGEKGCTEGAGMCALNGVSCPSTRFCAAVGNTALLLTSSAPASGRWSYTRLPFVNRGFDDRRPMREDLRAVSCASKRLCVVVGDNVGRGLRLFVSTRPAGGLSDWKGIRLDPAGQGPSDTLTSVACARTTLCVAGDITGRLAVSTAPSRVGSWKLRKIERGPGSSAINAVACARSKLCLAGTQSGVLLASKDPARGARAFTHVKLSAKPIIAVACRSAKLCVAIDWFGHAWASRTPTGRASSWHAVMLEPRPRPTSARSGRRLTALACAPSSVCVAGDDGGRIFIGR